MRLRNELQLYRETAPVLPMPGCEVSLGGSSA